MIRKKTFIHAFHETFESHVGDNGILYACAFATVYFPRLYVKYFAFMSCL